MARRRIERVECKWRRLIGVKAGGEPASLQGVRSDECGNECDATPGDRGIAQHFGIVRAQRPGRLDPVIAVLARQLPLIAGGEESVSEAIVTTQVARVGWRATCLEIIG